MSKTSGDPACKICHGTGEIHDSTDKGDHLLHFTVSCDCIAEKTNEQIVEEITPDPNCEFCHGEGEVHDWVDYGSTKVQMPSFCECVTMQAEHEDSEIVIVPFESDPPYDHTGHDTLEEKYL